MTDDGPVPEAGTVPRAMRVGLDRGLPLPFGATPLAGGVNFSVFSRHATGVTLDIFRKDTADPLLSVPLDARFHRTGDAWHVQLRGLDPDVRFGWRVGGGSGNPRLNRFMPTAVLLDPYARAVAGAGTWGRPGVRHSTIPDEDFAWGLDQPLNVPLADSIIYELHVRGFTRHPSSRVLVPGTFLALTEQIPYLKQLGVTAIELLPVTDFDETENPRVNPITGERLWNYWGYSPIGFFALKAAYAATPQATGEFKEMVKRFHTAGIEVILDMVLNHTAEGDDGGATWSFRGFDNAVYYILDPATGLYRDYTGCGNTLNCNHPVVRQMILDCLRYWVLEMHVDGFRFDLASVLGRGRNGEVLANPPIIEQIAEDPILADTKLIAEAWDAAGLYQVGSFPSWGRWAEWNGHFRDDIRKFVRGDAGQVAALAARLAGSADLYKTSGREPFHSINFVTCHDGFTLRDLVSYNTKRNEANGEDNRDGADENFSWNCGVEGETTDPAIRALRLRQARNFATLLLVAHGVPMLLGGDELWRTQAGNNNAYCHDSPLTWIDWSLDADQRALQRFFRLLISFRRTQPALCRRSFEEDSGGERWVEWHGTKLNAPDWSSESRSLAMYLRALKGQPGDHVYVIANAFWEPLVFELPRLPWRRVVDTGLPSPDDITEPGSASPIADLLQYRVGARCVVVLSAPR